MNYFRNKINFFGKQGFTLVEVMVTVGVLGVLALAVVNQFQLVEKNKKSSSQNAVVLNLSQRLSLELTNRNTCSSAANFLNQPVARTNIASISNGQTPPSPIIVKGNFYGGKESIDGVSSSSSVGTSQGVKVKEIETIQNPNNAEEMLLVVTFEKKNGFSNLFSGPIKIEIPLTVEVSAGLIQRCYTDITNSIKTIVQLSCSGNFSYYDPTVPPYGVCIRKVDETATCPAGKYIDQIGWDTTVTPPRVVFGCKGLQSSCSIPGQVITAFNANGSVTCGYPFPTCANDELMIKDSTTPGKFVCLKLDALTTCTNLEAISGFNSTGVICQPFWPNTLTCGSGLASSITTSSITCSQVVRAATCPIGKYVSSVDAAGMPICTPWITLPFTCPANQAATGVDTNGNLTCQPIIRRILCGGSYAGHNYGPSVPTPCPGGGTLMKYSATNTFCKYSGASCPGGWNLCPTYRTTTTVSCSETNSACSWSMGKDGSGLSKTLFGQAFSSPVSPQNGYCANWMRNSGPWVFSCSEATTSITTPISEVGCY